MADRPKDSEIPEPVPRRIGVDATNLGTHRTGVGNYIAAVLGPLCALHPETRFHLYSNEVISFPVRDNVSIRVSPRTWRGPLWQNLQLRRMLREDAIDVFWGANGLIPIPRPAAATVVTIHDLAHRFAPQTQAPLVRWNRRVFQSLSARCADEVLAVSQATADDIAAVDGRPGAEVMHPLAAARFRHVAAVDFEPVLHRHGLPDGFLLSVGTLEPRKNLAALVHAYVDRRHAGVDLPLLVLVGGSGWLNDSLVKTVAAAEARGFIRWLGFLPSDELPALYSACRAFVMPSLYEGFGMPLLEAQRCGAAVIHGDHGSMAEASGGLGVVTQTGIDALARMFDQLAAGTLPLACRLPTAFDNDDEHAAMTLWRILCRAHAKRTAKRASNG